jgi:transcriptional regulator with XRE-family HTH domain
MIRLKLWRLQEQLTQNEAARRLGIGESTLAMLESGRLRPTRSQVDILRKSFGSEVDSLFEKVQERVGAQP